MVRVVVQDRCTILIEVFQYILFLRWIRHGGYISDSVHERGLGKVEVTKRYVVIV